MNSYKNTSKRAPTAPTAPNRAFGKAAIAPTAPPPYKGGALEHGAVRATRNKKQVVKDCNHRLTDHEVELMRVMHEEFPRGHPRHIGYRKLTAIFGCSYTTTANICCYRKRVAGL